MAVAVDKHVTTKQEEQLPSSVLAEEREHGQTPPRPRESGFFIPLLLQAINLAWLAPILTLLVLNGEGFVIGPSFRCPGLKCIFDPYASNITQEENHLTSIDHNVMGSLQLVAKVLELWFSFAASVLVYNLIMLLANKGGGLPLRYIFANTEYANPLSFGRSFWTSSVMSSRGADTPGTSRSKSLHSNLRTVMFAMLILILCIISNLMGPATAVLLLPTLQRVAIRIQNPTMFVSSGSESPPIIVRDTESNGFVDATVYEMNGISFDFMNVAAEAALVSDPVAITTMNLEAVLNQTDYRIPTDVVWVPSMQTLIDLDFDSLAYLNSILTSFAVANSSARLNNETLTESQYNSFRSSLEVILQRQGPVTGTFGQCLMGNVSLIPVAADKSVRCYSGYTGDQEVYPLSDSTRNISTKCFRVGTGWSNARNDYAQFFISNPEEESMDTGSSESSLNFATASVDIYSVTDAIFLNSSTEHCSTVVNNQTDPTCDWDTLFSEISRHTYRNLTLNQQVTEYVYPTNTTSPYYFPEANDYMGPYTTHWCWSINYQSFATYALDLSLPSESEVSQATISAIESINTNGTDPMYVHPDWTLYAWAVSPSVTLIPAPDQDIVINLLTSLNTSAGTDALNVIQKIITAYALSQINYYETTDMETAPNQSNSSSSLNHHHKLQANATAEAWSYDISSHSSKLGFGVAIIGCVVVCAGFVVDLLAYSPKREVLEFFVTGLRQSPPEEIAGLPYEKVIKKKFHVATDGEIRVLALSRVAPDEERGGKR